MKRIILPLLFVGIVIVALGGVGYVAVKYVIDWTASWANNINPISYEEMDKLQDKGEEGIPEIPRLVACFDKNDEDLRVKAAETLGKIGGKAVDPVRARLKDKNAKVRYWAIQTLAMIGPPATDASDEVLDRLQDSDADVRFKAVYALGKFGVKSDAVFEGMLKALSDKDDAVVETALETLKEMGTPPKGTLPVLAMLAKDKNPQVSGEAMRLLGQLGEPAVPTFTELLKTTDTLDRAMLLQSIASLGPQAKPLLPELQTIMIKNANWDAEEELIATFKKCGPDGAEGLAMVIKAVHDPQSPHFANAALRSTPLLKGMGAMGSEAKVAVPTLIELLKDRDNLRPQILETLGDIGPAAKDAIPAVEALAKDPAVGEQARVALKRMGIIAK